MTGPTGPDVPEGAGPCRFAVVGAGWRSQFFLRLAARLPSRLAACAVVARRPEVAAAVREQWGVPTYPDLAGLLDAERGRLPEFAVTGLPRTANADAVRTLVARGVPVLSETPPAPDLPALHDLWRDVGAAGLVQVAEQYHLMPGHAARRALVGSGAIGVPSQVQVSSTHDYHAVSLIRFLLGIGHEPAVVHARRFTGPLVDPLNRAGWTDDATAKPAGTTIATLDFGSASGVYDFTDNQWHNPLRGRRILVRGSHGELDGDDVTWLADARTVLHGRLERRQTGHDLDLDGYDTQHIAFGAKVLWRNPFEGLRWADEEIAIGSLLLGMAGWVRGEGPPPYPLAQGCQDHALALAIHQAVATAEAVRVEPGPWAVDLQAPGAG